MDLNLRNVDKDLVQRLKVEALQEGKTLRQLCLEKLGWKVELEKPEVKGRECPRCHEWRSIAVWGNGFRCRECGVNFY